MKRINALRKTAFEKNGFRGYLIFNGPNMLYFLGFGGAAALFVPYEGECTVYVYGVNYEQAKAQGKGFNVQLLRNNDNVMAKLAVQANDCRIDRLLADALSFQSWRSLTKELGESKVEVNGSFIQELRAVKDRNEIQSMRRAGELTSRGMEAAFESVKVGTSE